LTSDPKDGALRPVQELQGPGPSWIELDPSRHTKMRAVFDERELVDLAIAISLMNAYNRMAISFRHTLQAVLEH
jgi:alkylhydroperoxidase family enzyme